MEDRWASGAAYESFMGRWSRRIGLAFVEWLAPDPGGRWLELGSGTGALTEQILRRTDPDLVIATDSALPLLGVAQRQLSNERVSFVAAEAGGLPLATAKLDWVVSGLVLNFLPKPDIAIARATRLLNPGGRLAAYVWDYAEGMQFLRHFWDAVIELDPAAAELDEAIRFPLCRPGPLADLIKHAGLDQVEVVPLEIVTEFESFADFWQPFLAGTGPAPTYVHRLPRSKRVGLEAALRAKLGGGSGNGFVLKARAWAVRAVA
jgi:SAM-dependent methyltransferase